MKSGAVDAKVVLPETLVSIHNRRQWVADFHNRVAYKNSYLKPFVVSRCSKTCGGLSDRTPRQNIFRDLGQRFKSINNWDELFCSQDKLLPDEISVVQTQNSWHFA